MTEVTPIYEEDETEQEMDALQESGEPQILADKQTRSADGIYQSRLKIWFDADSGTVTGADEDIETLDLPQTVGGAEVKAIGEGALSGCASLSEVVLPVGLVKIWDGAFENCRSLTSIAIPGGTKQIGLTHDNYDQTTGDGGYYYCGVFSDCVKLKEVSFGSGLSVLGNDAFRGCAALEAAQLTTGKLKAKKKYYVRIRTYKKVKKKTYYSSWSKTKTMKISK